MEEKSTEEKKCSFCKNNAPIENFSTAHEVCGSCLENALKDFEAKIQRQNAAQAYSSGAQNLDVASYVIGFGKHRGKKILDVEPDYIRWCLENFDGLRDVDTFNNALEQLVGERVVEPAAASKNQQKFNPAPAAMASANDINSQLNQGSETNDFPF